MPFYGEDDLTPDLPRCPWCHTAKQVQPAGGERVFYCRRCSRMFDTGDDGIDTISYGPPSRRIEREERQRERGARHGH